MAAMIFKREKPLALVADRRRFLKVAAGCGAGLLLPGLSDEVSGAARADASTGFKAMSMMTMPHPMHFHGQQFRVLRREVNPKVSRAYATFKDGFVDAGWKDVVLIMPGERVLLQKRFDDYTGLFPYHCHNLEHEDMGMMRNLLVES